MYQMSQRAQDPSAAHDQGHTFQRHEQGGVEVDAEGERDFEVG